MSWVDRVIVHRSVGDRHKNGLPDNTECQFGNQFVFDGLPCGQDEWFNASKCPHNGAI